MTQRISNEQKRNFEKWGRFAHSERASEWLKEWVSECSPQRKEEKKSNSKQKSVCTHNTQHTYSTCTFYIVHIHMQFCYCCSCCCYYYYFVFRILYFAFEVQSKENERFFENVSRQPANSLTIHYAQFFFSLLLFWIWIFLDIWECWVVAYVSVCVFVWWMDDPAPFVTISITTLCTI